MLTAKEFSFSKTVVEWRDSATVSVVFEHEDVAVVAYSKEDNTPYVIVTNSTFSMNADTHQCMNFKKIFFHEFKGYEIWSCEIVGEEMRICLVK